MRIRLIELSAVAVVALFLTVSAYADGPVVVPGNCPNGSGTLFHPCMETNVLFSHGIPVHSGPFVEAPTNSNPHEQVFQVRFSTNQTDPFNVYPPHPNFLFAAGGQSDVDACPEGNCAHNGFYINNVTITVPAADNPVCGGACFYEDLILNPQGLSSLSGGTAIGHLAVTVSGIDFTTFTLFNPGNFSGGSPAGNHFLTIEATFPQEILSVKLFAANCAGGTGPTCVGGTAVPLAGQGFGDLKQPRISGIEGVELTQVPEPSSLLLLGSSVLGLAQMIRRKLM